MLNTNLTTIRWKKSLYYISEGVIFDIQNIKRTNDMDDCGSFLIDFSRADNVSKNAAVGANVNLINQTELFTGIPWLEVKFSEPELDISVPLQYLIEEGDTFTLNNVGQSHPNVYAKDYRNKFNQDFFETIRTYVNRTPLNYGETLVNQIMNILPAWLTCDVGVEMTRNYVISSFVKGTPWNSEQAINGNDDVITLTGVTLKTPMGDASISGSWNKEKIENLALVLVAVRDVNKLNISSELMEAMLDLIIENNAQTGNGDKLNSLYHIDYDNVGSIIDSEILAKVTDANTYWQYVGISEPQPESVSNVIKVNSIRELKEMFPLENNGQYTEEIQIMCDTIVYSQGYAADNVHNQVFLWGGINDDYVVQVLDEQLDNIQKGKIISGGSLFVKLLTAHGGRCAELTQNTTLNVKNETINIPDYTLATISNIYDNFDFYEYKRIKLENVKCIGNDQWDEYHIVVTQNDNISQTIFMNLRTEQNTIPDNSIIDVIGVLHIGDHGSLNSEIVYILSIFGNNDYQIIEPEIRHVNNIQEFKELGESGYNDDITIDGDVTFVYTNNLYIMIEDTTGGLVVYENIINTGLYAYNPGDIISGGIIGKYNNYSGMPEFIPSQEFPQPTLPSVTINPLEINNICSQSLLGKLVEINVYNETEYQFQQDVVSNHNVIQISNNETIIIRNFLCSNIMDVLLPVGNIKVTGFVWRYNNEHYDEWQLWIRDNDDIQIISEPEIEND